jgi:hypothetical protein
MAVLSGLAALAALSTGDMSYFILWAVICAVNVFFAAYK